MVTTLPLWNCLTGVASITLPLHFPELLQICTYMLNHSFEQVESRITLCGLNSFVNWPKSWMGMSWIGYKLNDLGCGDVDVLAPPVGADGWSNATIWATISFESVNQTMMTSSNLKLSCHTDCFWTDDSSIRHPLMLSKKLSFHELSASSAMQQCSRFSSLYHQLHS